jgi:ketosteroid isomerase-like protein
VLLDQTVKQASKGGGTTIDRNRLYLVLEKQKNGRWLVSQLRLV